MEMAGTRALSYTMTTLRESEEQKRPIGKRSRLRKRLLMSSHWSKKAKYFAFAAVLMLLGSIFALSHLHRNSAPWAQIHPGMTRAAVLAIAGAPQDSGWPENIVETWHKGSRILQHRLAVSYE